jgi:hypothetical protein
VILTTMACLIYVLLTGWHLLQVFKNLGNGEFEEIIRGARN